MTTAENIALLIFALVVAGISWRVPRAKAWIASMIGAFALSVIYARAGFPFPSGFAALCDITIVFLIIPMGKDRWEDFVAYIFATSALINILQHFEFGINNWAYVGLLIACNVLALIVIFIRSLPERITNAPHRWNIVNRAFYSLHSTLRQESAHK